jgi:hypothetical protein
MLKYNVIRSNSQRYGIFNQGSPKRWGKKRERERRNNDGEFE